MKRVNFSLQLILVVISVIGTSTACTTTKAKRKASKQQVKAVNIPPPAEESCGRGLLRECEAAVLKFVREDKLGEARTLATSLMNVRRSEGMTLLNAVEDASKLKEAARDSSSQACSAGNVRACSVLGNTLISENKINEGLPNLFRACELGDGSACHSAATHVTDSKEKQRLIGRSCELKFATGCYDFARMLDPTGRSEAAARAFASGCRLGHAPSCGVSARLAYAADDKQTAMNAASVACQGEVRFGCFLQAMIAGQSGKIEEARRLLTNLCVADPFACRELGLLELTQSRKSEAIALFSQACERADMPACMQLARHEQTVGNRDKALALYRKLCDVSEAKGCLNAALLLEEDSERQAKKLLGDGKSSARILSEANVLFHKACELHAGLGCLKMGFQRESAMDIKAAKQYFEYGCAAGEPTACDLVNRTVPIRPDVVLLPHATAENAENECDRGHVESCWKLTGLTELAH